MRVAAPASSANLGAGFDALGMALDMPFVLADEPDDALLVCEAGHPAAVAHAAAGGGGPLWWRSPIPPGRGLGFSGAARVAGAYLARRVDGDGDDDARRSAFEVAAELERHADNAAASAFGGVVVAAGGVVVPVPMVLDAEVVVWWPDAEVSTRSARAVLPDTVPMADAVFNVGRVALMVAALASGDRTALRVATEDRLHQTARLELSPASRVVLDAMLDDDSVLAAWLSGSGPTVAAFVATGHGATMADTLPAGGVARVLPIDVRGARIG